MKKENEQLKKRLYIFISAIIILIFSILFLIYIFLVSKDENVINLGNNIEKVLVSSDKSKAYIKIKEKINESVSLVRLIFIDESGKEYFFNTTKVKNEIKLENEIYDYRIYAKDIGLESFRKIKNVSSFFEYKEIEAPVPPEDGIEISIPDDCIPKTCEELEKECGSYDDECGNIINCPACAAGKKCENGNCINETCVSAADSITCVSNACGVKKNNCNQDVNCSLVNSASCISCIPDSRETICRNWICGNKIDNCGQVINCGICSGDCENGVCTPSSPLVYPSADWEMKTFNDAGFDEAKLKAFSSYVGGKGFVTRNGHGVYGWGSYTTRGDIASAAKPWYSFFLFKAIENGKIPNIDQKVNIWEIRLNNINANLGYKDRNITWKNFATQTSNYGVREKSGAAFDYNDWQMALFWDTLFLKVYGTSYSNVDTSVLKPMLTNILEMEDNPTFMAFGTGDRPGRIAVSPRDFARFGLLFLRKGKWKETQVISEENAIKTISSPLSNSIPRTSGIEAEMISGQRSIGSKDIPDNQVDHDGSYSYLWWLNGIKRDGTRKYPDAPLDLFMARGHGGKRLMVVFPSSGVVASWNDANIDGDANVNQALKLLKDAIKEQTTPLTGQIIVDSANPEFLKYNGNGNFFMAGPGDPENFLYRGIRNSDGTRNGDQMQIINKLKGTWANSIYLIAVRSHGGDGDSTNNPFISSNPSNGIDEDILNQWESWFTEMDKNNITIFFFFYDDDARIWDTGDNVGTSEKAFIERIVNKFEHHKNLIWVIAEEYEEKYSINRIKDIAAIIKNADDNKHAIAVHKLNGLSFSEFADDLNIDQFAIQYNEENIELLHNAIVNVWKSANGKYNLNLAEAINFGTGDSLRKKAWAVAMAGAYVMVLDMDIINTPLNELEDLGRLRKFMESIDFNEMAPHDELISSGKGYVLANPGNSYIVYLPTGGSVNLNLDNKRYRVWWYNPRTGGNMQTGTVNYIQGPGNIQIGNSPTDINKDWAAYIKVE